MNCLFVFALLVPLLPLAAAAGIAVLVLAGRATGDAGEAPTARLGEGAAWLTLLLLLGLDGLALATGAPGRLPLGDWFAAGGFALPVSFVLDGLALGYATLVALIGIVVLRYARDYLHREGGFHRFFLCLMLFLAGMFFIILADSLALLFVGWELVGVASYLLIGYAYDYGPATENAHFAFIANRIGDAGLILGLALSFWWLGTGEWSGIAAWAADAGRFDPITARLLVFGFVVAAIAKSAQLPLAGWLARALEGPTPSSAIFYGAVMVHAGVYVLIRLEPVLAPLPDIRAYIGLLGLATALYGWLAGLAQTDVKSSLVFATTTQVGLMFVACGLGWFELAAWHMGIHTVWRAYQFLLAPSFLHLATGKPPPAPAWLAGRQRLYTAALSRFWVDTLARTLVVRPARQVGRDLRDFDDKVIAPLVGWPPAATGEAERVIQAHGLAGAALRQAAKQLSRFEAHLVMQGGGPLTALLRRAGAALLVAEAMLEQPRYLFLLVLATFAVIL
jgi:NADH:ubiquinone oxidoreductase subunit 5 (subunit L)/multisubunit Na+/H+ antiporter MnhA subunit